ncbi:MAG: LamG-like jellyroll fold domain-containing protein [Opitutaceae bacterium]
MTSTVFSKCLQTIHRGSLTAVVLSSLFTSVSAQVTTDGFLNLPRTEAPGTLLSHPLDNGSEPIGRTTSLNYLNGWMIVGGEAPGSRAGSDLEMRIYDISDPENPIRRLPSDFDLTYSNDSWHQGNAGWNAHGSAQYGSLMLPTIIQVDSFGGIPESGGTNGVPSLGQIPIGFNRSSQAGPWLSTLLWYGAPDQDIEISRPYINEFGFTSFQTLGNFDLVGQYGGGDWHPMFFGDLLIYARSGSAARDGVVVYRLQYHDFDDADASNDTITPHYVGSLDGGFQGYWPNLFSDGTGLYVIGSATDILIGADITQAAEPTGDGSVRVAASMTVPDFTNASYPAYQDNFAFMHNRKVDMTRFLAGDPNPIVLTLDEVGTTVNTSQISLPVGNLWLTGGYPVSGFNQGMGIWVHQQAADTTPPRVSYHIPQANRSNYPRFAPLSFLIHEHTRAGGPRNGVDFTVRAVLGADSYDAPVSGFLIHDFSGNLTFTPDHGLDADTTYQVDFLADPDNEIGFRDAAGNYIEPDSFRFSTGGGIDAIAPPSFTSLTVDNYQPAPGETITISAIATGESALEYRFNFDGSWSTWTSSASTTHAYPSEGRSRAIVQIRDADGNVATDSLRVLVITAIDSEARPTQNSTMAIGEHAGVRQLWTVNPDANTVSVINASTGAAIAEYAVGENPRNIARDVNDRYWVTCMGSDEIHIFNADGSPHTTLTLDYGTAPFGIAPSPDGESLYVTLYNSAQVQRYSADTPAASPTTVSTVPTPRAIAVSPDGSRLFITRFISPELQGEIAEFDTSGAGLSPTRTITLTSANTIDGGDRSAGVPNYLAGIAIAPDGSQAAVVSKQDNTQRGEFFGVADLTHETTVRSVISLIDLTTNSEIRHTRRDFDNSDSPSAVAYTPLGDTILVTLQGNNRLVGIDALNIDPVSTRNITGSTESSPAVITLDIATGRAPQGLLIDPTALGVYTQDFMGRSVTVCDATPLLNENRTTLPLIATTDTVATELLADATLEGKRIFYNAADPRMSADGYISCASCHVDGGSDGRIWDFTGRGEGLRRTTDLRGRSGTGHGNVHWSGNFNEVQDFEHDIRGPFGGEGLLDLTPEEFAQLHPSPATGKTGLSSDLDALAAYVTSLGNTHIPRSPHRSADGALTVEAIRGRDHFETLNCVSCHSGDALTESQVSPIATHTLRDIGTRSRLSGSRLSQNLSGIDTPTLHGLHAARNYLHHGQAESLEEVFTYAGGTLLTSEDGIFVSEIDPNAVDTETDNPSEGGGGSLRGVFTGTGINLVNDPGSSTPPSLRFDSVDGGAGGAARIAIRYARRYGDSTAEIVINGSSQTITLLRQFPNNSWQTSGWRWLTVDATLNAGTSNTIEIIRSGNDFTVNTVLVANADDLATAQPHHVVQELSIDEQTDLLAFLQQLDGRDASGTPLTDPVAPEAEAPSIISGPQSHLLSVGNTLSLHVAVSGTGPFSYQWRRGTTPIGSNSPQLEILELQLSDSGLYSVTVTNAQGDVTSNQVPVIINPAIEITSTSLPSVTVGASYDSQLSYLGGISAPTWTLAAGSLPLGLTLSPTGRITGTPSAAARAELTLRISDTSGSATRDFTIDVLPIGGFVNDPDLILHYTFDENTGNRVWDTSPTGNNHSTDVPTAHWISDGRFGGGYGPADSSDGIADFMPADQSDLDFDPQAEPYTISLWVRSTTSSGYNVIIGKDRDGEPYDTQFRIWMTNTGNRIQAVNGNQYSSNLDISTSPINNGQWHMLTLVNQLEVDTWRTTLYYDDGTESLSFNTGSNGRVPDLLNIGNTSRGGNPWHGQIDDLRIYRRALTPAEIAALYAPSLTMSFDSWMTHRISPPDPLQRGPEDDPDGDSLSNIHEYLFGSDPTSKSGESHPQLVVSPTPPNPLRYHVTLNPNSEGWRIIVETSEDLLNWDPLATSENGSALTGDGTLEIISSDPNITAVSPAGLQDTSAERFYRVRVISQDE